MGTGFVVHFDEPWGRGQWLIYKVYIEKARHSRNQKYRALWFDLLCYHYCCPAGIILCSTYLDL